MNGHYQLSPEERALLEKYRRAKAAGQAGMGHIPGEERFSWENMRDWGQSDPWPAEVVYDPKKCPPREALGDRDRAFIDEMFCRAKEALQKQVFISKRPSFVEPPYWSQPIAGKSRIVTVAPAAVGTLMDWVIPDRHRLIMTAIGIDSDDPGSIDDGDILFWFALDNADRENVLPVFDYQSLVGGTQGQTAIVPGSIENPFSLLQNGCSFQVKGPHELFFVAQNVAAPAAVRFRSFFSFYQYELMKADEFASADLQL